MNTTISFNLAKLLKEKGFKNIFSSSEKFYYPDTEELTENNRGDNLPAPTISDVVMWIYERHGIWIWVSMELGFNTTFCWQLTGERTSSNYKSYFKTPTEAYLGAIEYTLTNLI
jgi:hypothetical protein